MFGHAKPQAAGHGSPTRRVVLLGASNLTRSFPTVVDMVRRTWSEPIEFMVAMGHGRSYGQQSAVLGRKFPGIFPCALWQDLHCRAKLPTTALVTDIGNDLLYGATPDRLMDWVERCLDQLEDAGAATVVTQMPVGTIEGLGERRFRFFRRMLFPRSTLTLADAKRLVREVNERLVELGETRKISVIPVSTSWYGFDPIHLRRRGQRAAWSKLLACWKPTGEPRAPGRSSLWTTAYLAALAPYEWSRFGIALGETQPCGRFCDGTTISLY